MTDLEHALARNVAETRRAREHGRKLADARVDAADALHQRVSAVHPGETLLDGAKAAGYLSDVENRARLVRMGEM